MVQAFLSSQAVNASLSSTQQPAIALFWQAPSTHLSVVHEALGLAGVVPMGLLSSHW